MAGTTVPPIRDAGQIKALLDSPEVASLIAEIEATRWTGVPATASGPWSAWRW